MMSSYLQLNNVSLHLQEKQLLKNINLLVEQVSLSVWLVVQEAAKVPC